MSWLMLHWDLVSGLALGLVSETLSIWQAAKYPTNSGFGGLLVAAYKGLKSLGAQPPAPPSA